jgi:hypothetical protein
VTSAPEGSPDAGHELGHLEGLAKVVVGARFEAHDDVDRVAAGGEHDDRDRGFPPDRAADLETVEPRQHDVEEDEVRGVRPPAFEGHDAVGGRQDLEAGRPKAERGDLANGGVVLDDQDPGIHAVEYGSAEGGSQASRRGGRPKSGNSLAVSRKNVMPPIRPPAISTTWSDQGSKPPPGAGLYCPNAGEPLAVVGIRREPSQPMPGPRHQRRMSRCVWSQRS